MEARSSFQAEGEACKNPGWFLVCATTGEVSEAFRELRDIYIRGDELKDKE